MRLLLLPLVALLLAVTVQADLSESFRGVGYFESWHDGSFQDRAMATGAIEYGAEAYTGGFSSGLNVSGLGSYFFLADDYSIRAKEFNGSIIAETDETGTTVDGNGTGKIETRHYGGYHSMVRPFPIGGMISSGVFEIHSRTLKSVQKPSSNETDETTKFLRELI